jgi:hypothetical protein
LRFVLRARELGFAIEEIRGLLALVDGGMQTCAAVEERTERHLADVRAEIADLRRIERVLATTAAKCSQDAVPECPVLDGLATKSFDLPSMALAMTRAPSAIRRPTDAHAVDSCVTSTGSTVRGRGSRTEP